MEKVTPEHPALDELVKLVRDRRAGEPRQKDRCHVRIEAHLRRCARCRDLMETAIAKLVYQNAERETKAHGPLTPDTLRPSVLFPHLRQCTTYDRMLAHIRLFRAYQLSRSSGDMPTPVDAQITHHLESSCRTCTGMKNLAWRRVYAEEGLARAMRLQRGPAALRAVLAKIEEEERWRVRWGYENTYTPHILN